jgi:aspartyl-tRNA(Asn)/glutamyl-tRNA(Gln) amidotransferase subunit A
MPTPAPAAQDIRARLAESPDVNLELVGRMTQFANYLGVPALTVPCGFSADRLPVAFQLLGPPFSESRLFRIGHAFQSATEYHLTDLDGNERDGLPCDYSPQRVCGPM